MRFNTKFMSVFSVWLIGALFGAIATLGAPVLLSLPALPFFALFAIGSILMINAACMDEDETPAAGEPPFPSRPEDLSRGAADPRPNPVQPVVEIPPKPLNPRRPK